MQASPVGRTPGRYPSLPRTVNEYSIRDSKGLVRRLTEVRVPAELLAERDEEVSRGLADDEEVQRPVLVQVRERHVGEGTAAADGNGGTTMEEVRLRLVGVAIRAPTAAC